MSAAPGAAAKLPAAAKLLSRGVSWLEKGACFGSLALLALIPFAELILRRFNIHIQGLTRDLMSHFFMLLVFSAAMLASKSKGHIAIGLAQYVPSAGAKRALELGGSLLAVFLMAALAWNAIPYIRFGLAGTTVGPAPVWLFALAMPLGYFVMAGRFALGLCGRRERAMAFAAMALGTAAALPAIAKAIWGVDPANTPEILFPWMDFLYNAADMLLLPAILLLAAAALSGMPIFAAIGGIATVMLMAEGQEPEAFHIPVFDMLTSVDLIAFPLFTLTGFFLSESRAGERLVKTFRLFFSWLPGGVVVVVVLISAFFSSFTGASGMTILALGGILYAILRKDGYSERVSIGLLTGASGTGEMFPPSLVIILIFSTSSIILNFMNVHSGYTVAHYFAGAAIPGLMLVVAVIAAGMFLARRQRSREAWKAGAAPPGAAPPRAASLGGAAAGEAGIGAASAGKMAFSAGEALRALRESVFEMLLPILLVAGIFSGRLTLLEASALSVIYVFAVEVFIKKDIALRDVGKVFAKAVPVVGGVLIILAMANGLSYAFVFSGVPDRFTDWVQGAVQSPLVFLLLLNLALLLVGSVVDMYAAIMVLFPLIVPLGHAYGIDPLHLGIIFILNLEAGFLTPPVGINLFLASSRFERPFMQICRYALPFFLVRLVVLLLVAYIPWLSTWLPGLMIARGL